MSGAKILTRPIRFSFTHYIGFTIEYLDLSEFHLNCSGVFFRERVKIEVGLVQHWIVWWSGLGGGLVAGMFFRLIT